MSDNKVKVLFIGGYGRSGSTLFDRMLGQIEGFFSIGELKFVWERCFAEDQLCGCGRPFKECPFWSAVVKETFGGFEEVNVKEVMALKNSVDHAARIPLLLSPYAPAGYKERLDAYSLLLGKLFSAIKKTSGCEFIVDSSKSPSYGLILSRTPGVELYVIHLVRDSRAVSFSWQRKRARPEIYWKTVYMPRRGPIEGAIKWNISNLVIGMLRRKAKGYIRVCYEDLVERPREVMKEVSDFLGRPLKLDFIKDSTVRLKTNHTVAGNPMRFKHGAIELRPDIEWKEKMPASQRCLVTVLTSPLLFNYGYIGRK